MSDLDDAFGGDRRAWAVPLGALVVIAVAVIGGGLVLLDGSPGTNDASGPAATGTDPADTPAGTATPDSTATAEPTATPAALPSGAPLDGRVSLADSAVTVEGNGSDELGFSAAVGDVNGDGTPDVVVGAPLRNASQPRAGVAFAFFGPLPEGDVSTEDADVRFTGESWGNWAGNDVAVADVDGDGVDDVVVSAPRNDAGARNAGAVYVVGGGEDLGGTVPLGSVETRITGVVPSSMTGYSVAAADVTGDGRADVLAGAPRGENASGRAYLVDGSRVDSVSSFADADATFVGEAPNDEAGWSVAVAADAESDTPAVLVGAPRNDAAGEDAGAAYAVAAPFDGNVPLGSADRVLRGPTAGALAGWSVAGPGDVDGDGAADLLVGAPRAGDGGVAYLAARSGGAGSLADAVGFRGAPGDWAGRTVDSAGDVDCDGTPDLLVGAPRNDTGGSNAGAAYVVTDADGGDLAASTGVLVGPEAGDRVGRATEFATVPGDGTTGFVVGAPFGAAPQTAHVTYADCSA